MQNLNGAFLISRNIFDSDIWRKPSDYLKIWLYILGKVNFRTSRQFERGENFFQYDEFFRSGISKGTIDHCLRWLKSVNQIETFKQPRGVIIKVLNYEQYQDVKKYKIFGLGANETSETESPKISDTESDTNCDSVMEDEKVIDKGKVKDVQDIICDNECESACEITAKQVRNKCDTNREEGNNEIINIKEKINKKEIDKIDHKKIASEFFESFEDEGIPNELLSCFVEKGFDRGFVEKQFRLFYLYWTEPSGRKLKWEKQKSFEIKRRLIFWFDNAEKWNKSSSQAGGSITFYK